MDKTEPKQKLVLDVEELKLISQVLFNGQWNGQAWEGTIKPLINKLAKIIDEIK